MGEHAELGRFEVWADLYYRRFHRLAPGKSEASATGRNSCDPENIAQYNAWRESQRAREDAVDALRDAEAELARLRAVAEAARAWRDAVEVMEQATADRAAGEGPSTPGEWASLSNLIRHAENELRAALDAAPKGE